MGVVVFGIGNVIQGDDGFGVHVLNWLSSRYAFPEEVSLIDGGTSGLYLLPFIDAGDRVLFLDAIDCGEAPGTVLRFDGDQVASLAAALSPHDLGLSDLLATCRLSENAPDEVVVLGVQPESTSLSTTLSPVVAQQIEAVGQLALGILERWGVPSSRLQPRIADVGAGVEPGQVEA